MGQSQNNQKIEPSHVFRLCLRKGCEQRFKPGRWNQRYCGQSRCLREVRRWQAAKRQRAFRQSAHNRRRQAEAEARRRKSKRDTAAERSAKNAHEVEQKSFREAGAWSRSNKISEDFCDRVGCYESLPTDSRTPARYCGGECRQAMRRVRDRERKWLMRHGSSSSARRCRRSSAIHPNDLSRNRASGGSQLGNQNGPASAGSERVGDYRSAENQALSSSPVHDHPTASDHSSRSFDNDDDSKTGPCGRSRPPPAG